MKSVQVNPFLLQCFFTVRRMQSNFFRYHFGLEWEKRKIVRRVHAKRILQTAPHNKLEKDKKKAKKHSNPRRL